MRDVTLREILVSIVIVLSMIGLGFFISSSIHDSTMANNEKYFKALKVDNDSGLFDYAIRTEVGDMLAYGEFKANNPVSDELIKGEYFAIEKVKQKYVMKTRIETYTDSKGNTKTRTVTYWEWDTVGREYFNTDTFTFLDREFNYDKVRFGNYKHIDTIKTSSHTRYKLYAIPVKFNGTLYAQAKDKTISKTELYSNKLDQVIINKESEADSNVVVFWIFWIALTGGMVFGFVALENRYLNGYWRKY